MVVYTRTRGFRHDSIPAASAAVRELAAREGLSVVVTEDPGPGICSSSAPNS
jgi:hypothetical protein